MGRAFPEPGTHIERRSTEDNAPQATPALEPAPAAPAPASAPATSEATQPVPPVSEQVQRTATALATKVWTSGAQPCAQLFAGRNLATAEELNYAIAMQWVTIDGDRIAPGAADRRVDPPIEVQTATWSPGGQLDWWVKDRREWWGRARGRPSGTRPLSHPAKGARRSRSNADNSCAGSIGSAGGRVDGRSEHPPFLVLCGTPAGRTGPRMLRRVAGGEGRRRGIGSA
jgi:hypothetical protein